MSGSRRTPYGERRFDIRHFARRRRAREDVKAPMVFFGWGRNSKTAQLDGGRALVLQYTYFHLFWLFRITWGLRYSLATATSEGWATRSLSTEEATVLEAPQRLTVNWWWRWGLLVGIGLIIVNATIASLFQS